MHPAYDRGGLLHKVEGVLFVRGRVALRLLRVAFVGLPTVTTTWHHGTWQSAPQQRRRRAPNGKRNTVSRGFSCLPRETGNTLARVP